MKKNLLNYIRNLYDHVIDSLNGENVINRSLRLTEKELFVSDYNNSIAKFNLNNRKLVILGAGKATCSLTGGFLKLINSYNIDDNNSNKINISKGAIIVPQKSKYDDKLFTKYNIDIYFGGENNLPDEQSIKSTEKVLQLIDFFAAQKVPILYIIFITGGASALLVSPKSPLTLIEKINLTQKLMASGCTIEEINLVRQQLSRVKGGKLAEKILKANESNEIITFIASDIIADPVEMIGSGPTVIVKHDNLMDKIELIVKKAGLESCDIKRYIGEKEIDCQLMENRVHNMIIINNSVAMAIAKKQLDQQFVVNFLGNDLQGEAIEVAQRLVNVISSSKIDQNVCWIGGGETTVTLANESKGKGGRCQEIALKFFIETFSLRDPTIAIMAVGTDGQDGPCPVAGVIYSYSDKVKGEHLELAREHLKRHDSYTFWQKYLPEYLVNTDGPTGVNVMDLYFVFRLKKSSLIEMNN